VGTLPGGRRCAASAKDICTMIACAVAANANAKLRRIIINGHCGGSTQPGPGVMLSDPGAKGDPALGGFVKPQPTRFDAPSIGPTLTACIAAGLAQDGIVQICSCGYREGNPVVWDAYLQAMAFKLNREVCACPNAANPSSLTGCDCFHGALVCKKPIPSLFLPIR
jgi:hypothetical protein